MWKIDCVQINSPELERLCQVLLTHEAVCHSVEFSRLHPTADTISLSSHTHCHESMAPSSWPATRRCHCSLPFSCTEPNPRAKSSDCCPCSAAIHCLRWQSCGTCPLCIRLVYPANSGNFPRFALDRLAYTDRPNHRRTQYQRIVAIGRPVPFLASLESSMFDGLCTQTIRIRFPDNYRLRLSSDTPSCLAPLRMTSNRCIFVLWLSSFPGKSARYAPLSGAPMTLWSRYLRHKPNFPKIYWREQWNEIISNFRRRNERRK